MLVLRCFNEMAFLQHHRYGDISRYLATPLKWTSPP